MTCKHEGETTLYHLTRTDVESYVGHEINNEEAYQIGRALEFGLSEEVAVILDVFRDGGIITTRDGR